MGLILSLKSRSYIMKDSIFEPIIPKDPQILFSAWMTNMVPAALVTEG